MKIFDNASDLTKVISDLRAEGKTIGFVPTMGALHEGHLSLINTSKKENDYTVISIFVNPTQFNNSEDLIKYPRTLDADTSLAESVGADIIFAPSVETVYPENYNYQPIDLGIMDLVMEGKFRPGHFQGVVQVVKRLFDIVLPTNAYFGLKDFQQVAVVKHMVQYFGLDILIRECPIIRNEKGLALSSRNARLSEIEKEQALIIGQTLLKLKGMTTNNSPSELIESAKKWIEEAGLIVEYIEIVNPQNLTSLTNLWVENAVCCITAYCGNVRLIDNMQIN